MLEETSTLARETDELARLSTLTDQLRGELRHSKAETALTQAKLKSLESFHLFVTDSYVNCIELLDIDGRILSTNESGLVAMEIDNSSTNQDRKWLEHWPNSSKQMAASQFSEALAGRIARFQSMYFTAKGNSKTWDVVLTPIKNAHDRVERILSVSRDITIEKDYETKLIQSKIDSEFANQAKSTFLSNMSHEIRSPMTAILGYLELLTPSSETDREYIDTIRRNCQFLLTLVNDILDLSKIESGKIEAEPIEFNPRDLLKDVCSFMEARAIKAGLSFTNQLSEPVPYHLVSDPIRIRQILFNLIGNAIKFTEEGSVEVFTEFDVVGSELRISVKDSGIGIEPEHLSRLFQPFEQADPSIVRKYGGTGLGLAISQRLAHLLNGRLEVASHVGQGSIFSLCIPITGRVGMEPKLLKNIATPHSSPNEKLELRVLIVDDRRDIRVLTQHLIQRAGGETVTCENGKTAIEIIISEMAAGRQFDAVLMDLQMPVMDGYTATRTLRKLGFTKPIIALTANSMESDREASRLAGCTGFLSKPINAVELIQKLKSCTGNNVTNL